MKKPICVLFLICSGTLACTRENPKSENLGENRRPAVKSGNPVVTLRALKTAKGFDRALAQEKLFLTKEAKHSWDEVVRSGDKRANDARQHRDRLLAQPDPADQWRRVLAEGKPATMVRMFPAEAIRHFEELVQVDVEKARPLAKAFAEQGELYPMAVLNAVERTREGLNAFQKARAADLAKHPEAVDDYARAASLLEHAGNPLYLEARYGIAASITSPDEMLAILDRMAPIATSRGYRHLAARVHTLRAHAMEWNGNFFAALDTYELALKFAAENPTDIASILSRRSGNYVYTGNPERAFRDAYAALTLLPRVTDLNAGHQSYGNAAMAAAALGYPAVAVQYQDMVVETLRKAVSDAPPPALGWHKTHLAIGLRARADFHVQLGHDEEAMEDLREARALADAIKRKDLRALFAMRINEVLGEAALKKDPAGAVRHFTVAIDVAETENSTYRAILHVKRAAAWRRAGDRNAMNKDLAAALEILREEGKHLRDGTSRGDYEPLWTRYFARFQETYAELIESLIEENDPAGAFVYAEQARAFEPLQLVLQSRSTPKGFRRIETKTDLQHHLDALPEDTAILEYFVRDEQTYTWLLTRGSIRLFTQRANRKDIEAWLADVMDGVKHQQRMPITRAMRAVYGELFREPLNDPNARGRTRIVIIPDGPMHGLPFAALEGLKHEGFLLKRASIATEASASLYFYSLARDRQFPQDEHPRALAIGSTAFRRPGLDPLPDARAEAQELSAHYDNAEILLGLDATVPRVLQSIKTQPAIIHFAGHAIANQRNPSASMLLLAPANANDAGELTAEMLMQKLAELERTRLVVLAACSTAAGQPVGPEGLSPLVRPIVAANVPAVVGTLWKVNDATAKKLLVSLHCHYRHGDDVAVALQHAQLERLQNNDPPMAWAPYQVVGYAGSPYARSPALEKHELVCTQHSLHGPDGLHSQ